LIRVGGRKPAIVTALKSLHRKVILAGALCAGGSAVPAAAQTVTGVLNVAVVRPNTIVGYEDLDFGNVARPAAAGTLTMNAQTGVLTTGGGLLTLGGTPAQGEFVGYGTPLRFVVINGPGSITLTRVSGAQTMTVNNLRMSVNGGTQRNISGAHRLDAAGFIFLKIGGRLNVGANQMDGAYIGTYTITANYL
jgi:hypothetical protein